MKATLALEGLSASVRLGYTEKERETPQNIIIDLAIIFNMPPQACHNDKLDKTICYDQLSKDIQDFLDHRSFSLIEHLGYELHHFLKNKTKENIKLSIKKLNPIFEIKNAIFTLCD